MHTKQVRELQAMERGWGYEGGSPFHRGRCAGRVMREVAGLALHLRFLLSGGNHREIYLHRDRWAVIGCRLEAPRPWYGITSLNGISTTRPMYRMVTDDTGLFATSSRGGEENV